MTNYQLLQNKVNKLECLLESSKLLNSTLDIMDVLQALLSESIANIKDGDAGIIFLYNESLECLETKTSIGFNEEIEDLRLLPGESITGMTFTQKKPLIFNSSEDIAAMTKTMRPQSQETLHFTFRETFPRIHSTLSCPLIFRDHCFGVIVIDGFKKDAKLTNEDLHFLEAISNQAAIAINNALSLERESQNAAFLEETNQIIETQKNAYKFTIDLHTKFTNMILHGCDVHDILVELSNLISLDCIVVNPIFSIVGHSLSKQKILKQVEALQPEWIEHILPLTPSMFHHPNLTDSIQFLPILVNQENYGWLGILSPSKKWTEKDSIAIERSLAVLALILLKIQEIHSTELRVKGEFLESLLVYRDIDYIHRTIQNFGYRLDRTHAVLVFDFESREPNGHHPTFSTSYLSGLQEQFKNALAPLSSQIIPFLKGTQFIFLMETERELSEVLQMDALRNLLAADPLLWKIANKGWRLRIGGSDLFTDLQDFNTAYQNALYAIEVGENQNRDHFLVFYSQLRVKGFLLNNQSADLNHFVTEVLGPLIEYDRRSHAHFLKTLKLYIQTNNSWTKTKETLFIHGNTLTYRLKRIEEILGLRLDDYRDRLNIQIALEILDLHVT